MAKIHFAPKYFQRMQVAACTHYPDRIDDTTVTDETLEVTCEYCKRTDLWDYFYNVQHRGWKER